MCTAKSGNRDQYKQGFHRRAKSAPSTGGLGQRLQRALRPSEQSFNQG
jgi:hypothetical protein